jgi:hypothetical protein
MKVFDKIGGKERLVSFLEDHGYSKQHIRVMFSRGKIPSNVALLIIQDGYEKGIQYDLTDFCNSSTDEEVA